MKMQSNRTKWTSTAVIVLFVGVLAAVTTSCVSQKQIVRSAGNLQETMWENYTRGTFSDATNSIVVFIAFVEAHKKQISTKYLTDVLFYNSHEHLAYMFLYSGNEIAACKHFNMAYENYKQMLARENSDNEILPKSKFIDRCIAGIEEIDAKTGVAWKQGLALNTNVVEKTKAFFIESRN